MRFFVAAALLLSTHLSAFVPTLRSNSCLDVLARAFANPTVYVNSEPVTNMTTGRDPELLVEHAYRLFSYYGGRLERLRGLRMLDVGSGTSEIGRYLEETYRVSGVQQLDWWYSGRTEDLERVATPDATPAELARWIEVNSRYLVAGVVQRTRLPSRSYDLITASDVFPLLSPGDARRALLELCRLLAPGGRLIVTNVPAEHRAVLRDYMATLDIPGTTAQSVANPDQFNLIVTLPR